MTTSPEITAIKPDGAAAERWTIHVDGRKVARAPDECLQRLGLRVGAPWTEALAEAVAEAGAIDDARRYVLRLLNRRAYSRGEIESRLQRKGHDLNACMSFLDAMERTGLIDDEAYARMVIRSLISARPAGRRLLEQKLRVKRIANDVASAAIDEALETRDESDDALELARKRFASMPARLDANAQRRRLYSYLARRGFSSEVCGEAVRETIRDID